MKATRLQLVSMVAAGLLVAAWGARIAAQSPVKVAMKNAQGESVGTATITEKGAGVSIAIDFKGLPPGEHALHIHSAAKCEAPAFTTAGGHFNPTNKKHGTQNPEGHHAGDMPNFTADAKGMAKTTIANADVTLKDGPNSLFTGGGTALVIHEKADDMKTDPAGAAGNRIACGVIVK
jgi:Cu-Zn family superoxide dismutase